MLQEAVDALFDNGRRGRPVTGPGNRALKSLSDMLKGKQGRFRQNLLGKRVDYSGRSVIVAGPSLKLHQCGLPKLMALELFKPFIMARLVERKAVQNIKAAKKMVESMIPEVWDVLEEVIHEHPVLLNRAPTLHRLGIQAFEPVLVEGKAIQVHPLVCHAFNADFDGDQMAVHVPLSAESQAEARILMLSANNILLSRSRRPARDALPGHGARRLLPDVRPRAGGAGADGPVEARAATRRCSEPRRRPSCPTTTSSTACRTSRCTAPAHGHHVTTTVGRILFNDRIERALAGDARREVQPRGARVHQPHPHQARDRDARVRPRGAPRRAQGGARARCLQGPRVPLREQGGHHDLEERRRCTAREAGDPRAHENDVQEVQSQYEQGLITNEERREKVIDKWTEASDQVAQAVQTNLDRLNPIYMMANSGARGSFTQIRQLAGMRGLMANPKGEIIERPIKASFMEGLTVLEYFISTHGARKGLADTALRTADSGYLTRRLVDVAQDVIVRLDDCKTKGSIDMALYEDGRVNDNLIGRVAAVKLATKRGRELLKKNDVIDRDSLREIAEAHPDDLDATVTVRSVLKCEADAGLCRMLLRRRAGHRCAVRSRRRRRDHRRPVDRRARHAAHDAHVPHRRCGGRRHHARPPACGGAVRGAQAQGSGRDRARVGQGGDRGRREVAQGDHPRRQGRGAHLPAAPPRTVAGAPRGQDRDGPAAQRGVAVPGGAARAPRPGGDGALPRHRGAEGLQVPGRRHQRQAHRGDRAPDAQARADRAQGQHRPPAGGSRGPPPAQAAKRRDQEGRAERRRPAKR